MVSGKSIPTRKARWWLFNILRAVNWRTRVRCYMKAKATYGCSIWKEYIYSYGYTFTRKDSSRCW